MQRLDELLHVVKEDQMVADVPLGAFLSSGIDSSAVVDIMQSLSTVKVKTFSIGFMDKQCNEVEYS